LAKSPKRNSNRLKGSAKQEFPLLAVISELTELSNTAVLLPVTMFIPLGKGEQKEPQTPFVKWNTPLLAPGVRRLENPRLSGVSSSRPDSPTAAAREPTQCEIQKSMLSDGK